VRLGLDGTGVVLLFAGFGILPGLILGFIGQGRVLWGGVLAGLALVIWQGRVAAQDTEWYAVVHAITIAATIWAVFVMIVTYAIVRRLRQPKAPNIEEGNR
jgi:heme/copper-type cytochrome/quinol oxidase subunit 2